MTTPAAPAGAQQPAPTRFQLPAPPATARVVTLSWMLGNVLAGLVEGKTNKAIGRDWGVTEDTIKTHVRRLFAALGTRDRLESVVLVLSGAIEVWVKPDRSLPAPVQDQYAGRARRLNVQRVMHATQGRTAPYPPPL